MKIDQKILKNLNAMKGFDNLESFLEHVALASLDQDWESEKVNLMTMHASKDWNLMLFFGWEEGLFPHQKVLRKG